MTLGKLGLVFTRQAGAFCQVADFKIKQISINNNFHGQYFYIRVKNYSISITRRVVNRHQSFSEVFRALKRRTEPNRAAALIKANVNPQAMTWGLPPAMPRTCAAHMAVTRAKAFMQQMLS